MDRVAATLRLCIRSDVSVVRRSANQLVSSGGKRLRPMLTLAAAYLARYRDDGHIALATAVELIHTATLLHDDVVDRSELRRAAPAAHAVWGKRASVFVGDYLFGQALRLVAEAGSIDAAEILACAVNEIIAGELLQLGNATHLKMGEDACIAVIRAKTAALFAAASELGPALATLSRERRAALSRYGQNLGLAFQLVDDALDYAGNEANLGKRVGDDFRGRKVTLPVIFAYRRGNEKETAFWARTIERGTIHDGDLDIATDCLRRHRALEDTLTRACRFGTLAKQALEAFPPSEPRAALEETVDFCVSRAH